MQQVLLLIIAAVIGAIAVIVIMVLVIIIVIGAIAVIVIMVLVIIMVIGAIAVIVIMVLVILILAVQVPSATGLRPTLRTRRISWGRILERRPGSSG